MKLPDASRADGHFPFVRNHGHCELCGYKSAALRYVTIRDSVPASAAKGFRLQREILVCDAHEEEPPVRNPRLMMAPGTSRNRPQNERLF
jgi:hypothetical protein